MCAIQLQIYERRSKFVKKGRESKSWKVVTADMMSDEEKTDDTYVRHQPEYRSEKFTAFLDKLDERSFKKQTNHARYKRTIGTPVKKTPPQGIEKWMIKSTEVAEQELNTYTEAEQNDASSVDTDDSDSSDVY